MAWKGVLSEWASWLPITERTPRLTLHEGGTPLVHARRLSAAWNVELYLKVEGANPTGSFKDRGMVLAVAKAVEDGARTVICASTGNTAASAAAYAARAGVEAVVVIPEGKIARGKLAQAVAHGARVIAVRGNFDEALTLVRTLAESDRVALVNSVNPYRLEGQKTAALEVAADLGRPPDELFLPVGNAGNISAYWMGFSALRAAGGAQDIPRLHGVQAEGAAPMVTGRPVEHPETVATAIRIGNPASWRKAEAAIAGSGGSIQAVSDAAILEAYHEVAEREGVFCEPASAASLAGLKAHLHKGLVRPGARVVAVLTGHGLKDPDTASGAVAVETLDADLETLRRAIGLVPA